MVWSICLALLLLLLPVTSNADMGSFAEDYLRGIEARRAAVFFSRCGSKTNSHYRATLIFEVGTRSGLLIEETNRAVVNLGTILLRPTGPSIEETHGGVYTRQRVEKLVEELVGYGFSLLAPLGVRALEDAKPSRACVNAP